MLSNLTGISVIGEAKDGLQAIKIVENLSPDVLILDVEMPIMNGLQVAAQLQEMKAPVRIIAISAYDDQQYISGMLENGVTDYILKEDVPDRLIEAIRRNAAEVFDPEQPGT